MKEFLSRRGIPFKEYNVANDPAAAVEMVRKSGQQGVPVITIDDQVVVGFDRPRLERLLEDKKAGRVSFGLSIADASRIALKHGAVPILGAFVGKVSPHSPAQRAGIQAGDIITEVNLRPIGNALDLEKALASLMPGSRVTIVFLRGEQRLRTELAL